MNNGSFSPSEVRIDVERELQTTHYKRTFSHRSNHDEGATLVFKNVCVTLNKQDILKNVSGLAKVGHMLAIMGPSGAGKSTLLNTLTGRTHARSGSITFNGQPINRHMRRKVSYVQQQDVFYPNLTLKETMTFAALLRLPDRMPHDKKMQRMHEIIDALELKKCLNTKIGGTFVTGLSGGERKRVSIACELLTNPKIIILDEPTSGLDSAIAYSLMSIMDKYSRQSHKTVVTTIHQPASQIFHMFANILLLTDGQVAYFGREDKIIGFFAGLGLHCDPLYNPADFILEQVKADPETVKRILEGSAILRTQEDWPAELRDGNYDKQAKALPSSTNAFENAAFTNHADDYQHTENIERSPVHVQLQEVDVDSYIDEDATWQTGFLTQYKILTWRAFVHAKDRFLSPLNLIQLLIAILAGLEWWQLARTEETASDRLGILFFLIVHFGFVPITEAVFHIFDSDGVFIKERSAGIYRLSAYYLSIMTSEFPMTFVQVTIFLNCVYWMTGLMADAYNFFLFYLTLLLSAYTAQSFGFFTGVVVRNGSFIIPVANTIMIISLLTGGFYNAHIAWWFVWMKYLSFISFVLGALSKIEFEYGDPLKCNYPNMTMYPEHCSGNNTNGFVPGEEFLKANSLDFLPFWAYFAVLAAVIIVFRILTYLVLRFLRRPTA